MESEPRRIEVKRNGQQQVLDLHTLTHIKGRIKV